VDEGGKRVSWVELYLDLVFVLAVGQLAHLIVERPQMRSVWIALGLFFVLWWTWVGFAVLYDRHGVDHPRQRILFLAASVPAGVAAAAVASVADGKVGVFAGAMAVTRVILAVANGTEGRNNLLQQRIARACLISAALFALSIVVPEPWRYVLWAMAIVNESRAMLAEDREAPRRARRDRDGPSHLRRRAHAAGIRAADHCVRRRAAPGGAPAAHRLLAGLRRDRDLPARHARVPARLFWCLRRRAGRRTRGDVPARPPGVGVLAARVSVAADGVGGHLRGVDHAAGG
jgi:Bacterial low temperature requirement A protein (LtrA)